MRALLPHLRAAGTVLLVVLNTLFWALPVHLLALGKLLLRSGAWPRRWARWLTYPVTGWIRGILWIQRFCLRVRWDIQGVEGLRRDEWYFINSNHQSWADIPVLLEVLTGRTPFPKIFLKRQLKWIPILGSAWWALDYPFMQRHSRAYLAAHPEKAGEDLETTRRACRRYRHMPVAILNFIEGTRFTPEKLRRQASPYRHLLRPKAGGFAFALEALEGRIRRLLDITIVYPGGRTGCWDYLGGRIPCVRVRVQNREIPPHLLQGDYQGDAVYREAFQQWLQGIWREKDALIGALRDPRPAPGGGVPSGSA
jgi:1-acyl-sn-glycerol-3-phosphate acyltransferase